MLCHKSTKSKSWTLIPHFEQNTFWKSVVIYTSQSPIFRSRIFRWNRLWNWFTKLPQWEQIGRNRLSVLAITSTLCFSIFTTWLRSFTLRNGKKWFMLTPDILNLLRLNIVVRKSNIFKLKDKCYHTILNIFLSTKFQKNQLKNGSLITAGFNWQRQELHGEVKQNSQFVFRLWVELDKVFHY